MKIKRLRLKNFGGVVESEVAFAPRGVTIVEGPNEVGKSSLFQALNLLLDYRDDSQSKEVRAVKPADRDVGAEVEADLEIAGADLTYMKKFNRNTETRLTIRTPRAESLTGREAHERVETLLQADLDTNLWKALRIVQGVRVDLPELKEQPALTKALDRAAGVARGSDQEDTLFEAARGEYLRYWTDKGKEKEDPIGRCRGTVLAADNRLQELASELRALDSDVDRHSQLQASVVAARASAGPLEDGLAKCDALVEAATSLRDEVERLRATHEGSNNVAAGAALALESRQTLAGSLALHASNVEELTRRQETLGPELAKAIARLDKARASRDTLRIQAADAGALETLRRKDLDYWGNTLQLEQMEERLGRVLKAELEASAAVEQLATLVITKSLRDKIRSLDADTNIARVMLEASSPKLQVQALTALDLTVNEAPRSLPAGDSLSSGVPEPLTLIVKDVVEIRFSPGTSDSALRERLSAAERELCAACEAAGVQNFEEAELAWASRETAERVLTARDNIYKDNLRDLTRSDLEQRIKRTRARLDSYTSTRPSTPDLPGGLDEARRLVTGAESSAAVAADDLSKAEDALENSRNSNDQLREQGAGVTALLDQATADLGRVTAELAKARSLATDSQLEEQATRTAEKAHSTAAELRKAEDRLAVADLDGAVARRQAAREARQDGRDRLDKLERELEALGVRLETLGERGLGEAHAECERNLFEARSALERLLARAAAALTLYRALERARDAARIAYVAPLRESIERLGRHVFGPSFRVGLNDELRVVTRTLDGITLPFEVLSSGAKEQIGLLVRLAAAAVATGGTGVPLVLDDALGSTGPERLEGIGAVLSLAGRECQAIVLTSAPERYAHVGGATHVRLATPAQT